MPASQPSSVSIGQVAQVETIGQHPSHRIFGEWVSISVGSGVPNIALINTTYLGEEIVDSESDLIRKWYLNVKVNETHGSNIEGANVTGWNVSGAFALIKEFKFLETGIILTSLEIESALKDVKSGKCISHEEVVKQSRKWSEQNILK